MLLRASLLAAALLVVAVCPDPLHAQVPQVVEVGDETVEVRLADGSVLYGRITGVEGDRITLVTTAGARIELERAQIRSLSYPAGRMRDGAFWEEDPHATRLFFAPTGRSLAAGEGYVGVYELFFPFVTYGVTDAFTVAAGTPIVPGAIGEFAYLGPKLRIVDRARTQLSLGAFAGIFEGGTAGLLYGVGTFGDRDNALTAGAGWAFYAGEGGSEMSERPLIMVGGETRVGRRLKLLTENYFVPGESAAVISGGVRLWGERLSADAGLGAIVDEGCSGCVFPLVNFVYSFGTRR